MSNMSMWDIHPLRDAKDELEELRQFYQLVTGCDAENRLLAELFIEGELDLWADLTVVCNGLREYYAKHPRSINTGAGIQ